MANIQKRAEKALAIEIFATQPDKSISQVAVEVGVSPKAMYNWRCDPKFMDAIYEKYMVTFGGELPAVLSAMVREAKAGNVQAGRLVLEHSGKLVKNVNITIDSPFEKWLKKVDDAEVIDGEIIEDEVIGLVEEIQVEMDNLPPREVEDPVVRKKREKKSLAEQKKKAAYNMQQKEWYRWKVRAKAAGVEMLKGGRPTPGQRLAWEQAIIRKENEKESK
jgi:DNA-directed RNA polymerase subunit H (RpoH/RPB5)